jgi:type IV pilus assembly protein PilY1
MNKFSKRLITTCAGLGWCLLSITAANAQDVEIFIGSNAGVTVKPNILFILDDSISMNAEVDTQTDYDPSTVYPGGSCGANPNRVYWTTGNNPPSCYTDDYFNMSALVCQRARNAFDAPNGGSYQDHFAQYDPGYQNRWERLSDDYNDRLIECADDLPDAGSGWAGHGDGSDPDEVYPRDGDDGELWTDNPYSPNRISWGSWPTDEDYNIYSGNYMNWYYGDTATSTRIEVMQQVATNIINSINGVNVGLMHFNPVVFNDTAGGLMSHAVEDVSTARASIIDAIEDLSPQAYTPLSETMYEAFQYMTGRNVVYGTSSVSGSRQSFPNQNIYNSPIDLSCQKNHIVLLTDGVPTRDSGANSLIQNLVDAEGETFGNLVGTCDVETYPPVAPGDLPPDEDSLCLDDLAEFMHKADLSILDGQQSITTHTVGFLVDLPVLEETAARGGGEYHTADNTAELTTALTNIVANILNTQATFAAPSISINAFNQTRHLNDIYVGLFRPSSTSHWPGNLKKFRLRASDSRIVDANNLPIVDPATGVFADYVQDFWSDSEDGTEVTAGGAANEIPAVRNVYTYRGTAALTSAANAINSTNLNDSDLGTGDPDLPTAQNVIDFINGIDVGDEDQDGNTSEPRRQLGDPLHSRPVVMVYGPTNNDALVFLGTNDGVLHAFNVDDGSEEWAFLPPEFLDQQVDLLVDNTTDTKTYGVDGHITIQTIADADGEIESSDGERVFLFFGMRRGGDAFYALDITDPDAPEVLWRKEPGTGTDAFGEPQLPGFGQSWSAATPTRIDIQGATQNTHKLAIVLGGGYDASQDATASSTDGSGNSIYILDMLTGDLLWRASNSGADQNFSTANWSMDYSIPADIRVVDIDGDSFGDRMYAADMGGQVWRFDISNGNAASDLIAGGVIAQLGAAGDPSPTIEETRRFYYAPDVAFVANQDYNFVHIGIGSGHRAHPNSTDNQDEFFALRDYFTYGMMTQTQYNNLTPIRPENLVDVTTDIAAAVPQGSPGWRLKLNDGGWAGEKVLAEARTFDDEIFISTYRPGVNGVSCEPALGTTRQYIVSIYNAAPVNNLDGSVDDYDGDGEPDPPQLGLSDRYREFTGPPPPETVFFFPGAEEDTDGDGDVDEDDENNTLSQGIGETVCQGLICEEGGETRFPIRTFWSQDDIE